MVPGWINRKISILRLEEKLRAHPDISKVERKTTYLHVTFRTSGVTEHWVLNNRARNKWRSVELPKNGPFFKKPIETQYHFEPDPFGRDELLYHSHFIITKKSLKEAGFCDKRIALHRMIQRLLDSGWNSIKYPTKELGEDLRRIIMEDYSIFMSSIIRFHYNPKPNPAGRRVVLNFSEPDDETLAVWSDPKKLWQLLSPMFLSRAPITREKIVRRSLTNRIISPNFYRAIFNQWNPLKGLSVLDLAPHPGRAIAVSVDRGEYHYAEKNFDYNSLGDYLTSYNLPNLSPNNKPFYDVILLNGINPISLDNALPLYNYYKLLGKTIVIHLKKADLERAKKLNPRRIVRIHSRLPSNPNLDNYLLMMDQT
tara:strand:+ start:38458 stop:39561 length:1104 start_codon:yes stop_codon:yes gene_type:complete